MLQESQEKLDAGIKAVEELISQDLAPLVYDRSRKFEGGDRDNGYNGRVCLRYSRSIILSRVRWLIDRCMWWTEEMGWRETLPRIRTSTQFQRSSKDCRSRCKLEFSSTHWAIKFADLIAFPRLQGLFVKWIQQETQTRVQIKGIGSGYIETETGMESQEPMHIAITYVLIALSWIRRKR